jgi:hypothetical protein
MYSPMPQKLSRAQIKEGLDQIPIESLLSSGTNKKANLTAKQKEFARGIALGKTKAQAYRDSYNTKGTPSTQGNNASRLSKDSRIATEVEAYKLAIEAEKHRTPGQLKALLVQQLVQHSLDEDFPPSSRVQCLRLLGQLYEVGAFVERKEIVTISKSADIRARLLATLGTAIDIEAKTVDKDSGQSLLEELAPAPAPEILDAADPTEGVADHSGVAAWVSPTHTVSDIESPEITQKFSEKSFRGDASDVGQITEAFEDMK